MSFTGSLMIKKVFLDRDSLKKYIIEYFKPDTELLVRELENNNIIYRNFCAYNIEFCLEEKTEDDHYSHWESYILGDDLHFSQQIIIRFEKTALSTDQYVLCIGFFRYLKEKTESEMLFSSDTSDEICLFREDKIIFANGSEYLEELI